jgi:hypothetical protein
MFYNLCESFLTRSQKLQKATISFFMHVYLSAWNNSASTGRIFMKFDIWVSFFKNLPRRFKFN